MNTAYQFKSLNGDWQLSRFPVGTGTLEAARSVEHITAPVPGDVHQALQRSGEIGDPLVGAHIERLRYAEDWEWWYRRTFSLPRKEPDIAYRLYFEGIDLNGRVFLNGRELGRTNNAFTPYEFDVTDVITAGENEVAVSLDCGLYTLCADKDIAKYDPQDPGAVGMPIDLRRIFLRKPQFVYFWDWSERLVTAGLWRGVELRCYRQARITDFRAYEDFHEDGSVTVHLEAETDGGAGRRLAFSLEGFGVERTAPAVSDEAGRAAVSIHLAQPRLWYPNGYGEQALYTLRAALLDGEQILSEASMRHGIRRVELDESLLEGGEGQRFTIRVNGRAVYCKGANWVPADSITANITDEKYERLLAAARDAHYNMLRVWGGGTYERERFYELCDEYGILLWHDFMFANGYFPTDDPDFRANIERELPIIIRQLRSHACVAVWCGNNEIQWQHKILIQFMKTFYGLDIYEELLPRLLAELDGTRPYRESSPFGRTAGDAHASGEGDTHSWYIWLGNDEDKALDIRNFLTDNSRFVTEYGVQSYPCYASMREYLCGDVSPENPAWQTHNNYQEIGRIAKMLERYYVEDAAQLDIRPAHPFFAVHARGYLPLLHGAFYPAGAAVYGRALLDVQRLLGLYRMDLPRLLRKEKGFLVHGETRLLTGDGLHALSGRRGAVLAGSEQRRGWARSYDPSGDRGPGRSDAMGGHRLDKGFAAGRIPFSRRLSAAGGEPPFLLRLCPM